MVDVVILSVPGTINQAPPAAPAILKAACVQAGFSCRTIDYNIKFYRSVPEDQIADLETYFCTGKPESVADNARQLIHEWAQEVAALNPRFVGISVFTYQCKIAARLFCQSLRRISTATIILGGQGIADGGINGGMQFAQNMIQEHLADHWIKSEGERSLVELLRGNVDYPGIDSDTFDQITDLDSNPLPDYSDYMFHQYRSKLLPITGSRGCVRECSFCDIHEHWRYQYRSGASLFNEMTTLSQRYGITHFYFSDSLVNGSLREFRKLCGFLAEYNQNTDKPITWSGQYIVRAEQHLKEDYWQKLAASGAQGLFIGIETGSDRVREHMNKKFTNADVDYTMRMLDKYNVTCEFLMIVGYPTETEQDFQDTLDMMTRYKPYAGRIITNVAIGSTLGILPGTPLHYQAETYNIELDTHENNWIAWDNPDLTLAERIRRRHKFKQHVLDLGYIIEFDEAELILNMIESNLDTFEKRNKVKKLIRIKSVK